MDGRPISGTSLKSSSRIAGNDTNRAGIEPNIVGRFRIPFRPGDIDDRIQRNPMGYLADIKST
ncbi:MAG: hypothetical protein M2R45_03578 [Verrucomicrobia subdivision 3 bacterium]|nr:hypothetical protein [Limisphaerales bacterium]MCS1414789.1 hypothetical protein [Limisphaerales bacterium]